MTELGVSFVTLSGTGFVGEPRFGVEARARAAAEAGFDAFGVRLAEFDDPEDLSELLELPARHGVSVAEVEFLSGWALAGDARAAERWIPQIRRLADEWGPFHLTSGEFGDGTLDLDIAASNLRSIAAALEPSGVTLAVEAFAWSSIADYQIANEIVTRADAPNAGLMLDVWHFFNTGGTLDWLGTLPSERVAAVQLNDGARVHDDILAHARSGRLLPGAGDLDVTGLLAALHGIGYRGRLMVESGYPQLFAADVTEAAGQALAAGRATLEQSQER
ncbi:sugar phosphate isomerase/epimerase family protein [Ruicaihuangia caeni]|uniref:TIM barrel protein n=1 Tax=Ruicaihuangia caeni TaxID=3042517 RepID=A0AAW6T7C6_9MICO|nr:TIM barrel protein [Klugiella sp. YN-L-19]MDI2099001.1 TIM barrel protein [Klugiella sp. YN-L-19]